MDKNQKPYNSKQPNGDQEKVLYSPTKDYVQLARLKTEKNIKTAEAKYRMDVHENSYIWRNDSVPNNAHILRFTDDQFDKACKCREEIRVIIKNITEIEKRIRENRYK